MRFEWDENKNQANIRNHGFSSTDAWQIFESPMLVNLDTRSTHGEDRWIGIGLLQNRVIVIVFTELDEDTIGVISLRKALKHEH